MLCLLSCLQNPFCCYIPTHSRVWWHFSLWHSPLCHSAPCSHNALWTECERHACQANICPLLKCSWSPLDIFSLSFGIPFLFDLTVPQAPVLCLSRWEKRVVLLYQLSTFKTWLLPRKDCGHDWPWHPQAPDHCNVSWISCVHNYVLDISCQDIT